MCVYTHSSMLWVECRLCNRKWVLVCNILHLAASFFRLTLTTKCWPLTERRLTQWQMQHPGPHTEARVNLNKLLKHVMSATFQPIGAAPAIPIRCNRDDGAHPKPNHSAPSTCQVQLSTKKPIKLEINCTIVATVSHSDQGCHTALIFFLSPSQQNGRPIPGVLGFLHSKGVSLFIVAAGRILFALHSLLMHAIREIFAI